MRILRLCKKRIGALLLVILFGWTGTADVYAMESRSIGAAEVLNTVDDISPTEWQLWEFMRSEDFAENYAPFYANEPVAVPHWGYYTLGVCKVDKAKVYLTESDSGKEAGQMQKGFGCEIVNETDNFYYIVSGNLSGYIKKSAIAIEDEAMELGAQYEKLTATVTAKNLKIRSGPGTKYKRISMVKKRTSLPVVEELADKGWVQVEFDESSDCYVSMDYVNIGYTLETGLTMMEVRYGRGVTDVGVSIAEYAQQFIGNPYVWGGSSLTKGADCSGFTMTIFKKYGVKLTHSARAQSKCGIAVSVKDLKPGDLVFYSNESGINHVTIYIGNGEVCHASSPKTGIIVTKLNYRKVTCCRRLIY